MSSWWPRKLYYGNSTIAAVLPQELTHCCLATTYCVMEIGWHLNGQEIDFEIDIYTLHWRHNDHDSVSNHQPHGCLLNGLFRRRSKKTSKLCVTHLCVGNSPGPVNVSIWWRHHENFSDFAQRRNISIRTWASTFHFLLQIAWLLTLWFLHQKFV